MKISPDNSGDPLPKVNEFGDAPEVLERIVVSPALGVFVPSSDGPILKAGDPIEKGHRLGTVESLQIAVPVVSAFSGVFMDSLADAGQRVRKGQPIAWIRIA
jgi:biotin carboxyl carrier protein